MVIIKCKMCGGELELISGSTVAQCEYCGSQQTVPIADNERKLTLFSRANRLRIANEFDKAAGIYESIVADFPKEAEAYWGLILCKYGIEYVDDPATGKKVPTCHRSSFDSVSEDPNLEQTLEHADALARHIYQEEARQIEQIRKDIIAVSNNEQPYDIFICYKEAAEDGQRTVDSVLAQDIYDALTEKGYRTFFARITLEDKLGQEYEPYIFAALNSAKVMLVIGTNYEHFNAVWVKNEWSRYLKLMEKDKSRHLIPCFKGIDAYDMPKEFSKLQAQDLGKVGAVQDLLRGIDKLIAVKSATAPIAAGVQTDDVNRIYIYTSAMEDMRSKEIKRNKDAVKKLESLSDWGDAPQQLENAKKHLKKRRISLALRWFLTCAILIGGVGGLITKVVHDKQAAKYNQQLQAYEAGVSYMETHDYYHAYYEFVSIPGFQDADRLAVESKENMLLLSDAIKAVTGTYYGTHLMNYCETQFSLESYTANVDGEQICYNLIWDYVGPTIQLDFTDPASLSVLCDPEIMGLSGEWITSIHGGASFDTQTGEFILRDGQGNTYAIARNKDAGTITLSGGEFFGNGITFAESRDIVENTARQYETLNWALRNGMTGQSGAILQGSVDFEKAHIVWKDATVIEGGYCGVDPATGHAYITGGDPNWMLQCIPDTNTPGSDPAGYTIQIIGYGCPVNITGYYKLDW